VWKLYAFFYLKSQLHLDALAASNAPETDLEGLAFLSCIHRRETGGLRELRYLRGTDGSLKKTEKGWTPENLYCDRCALRETLGFAQKAACDEAALSNLITRAREAERLTCLPALAYRKGRPYRMAPLFAEEWMECCRAQPSRSYPVLEPLDGLPARRRGAAEVCRALLEEGGAFHATLALHLLLCGQVPDAAALLTEETAQRLQTAAERYQKTALEWIAGGGAGESHVLLDQRIAVERTLREIDAWMREHHLEVRSGPIHSLGYW